MKFTITSRYFRFGFSFLFQRLKNTEVIGISNRTSDGLYIPFMDYDGLKLNWLTGEIRRLQKDFNLSDFYIFKSSNKGFHAVCFDKLVMHEFIDLLRNSSVDSNFLSVPLKYGSKQWNLRVSKKESVPEYVLKIQSFNNNRKKSSPHIELFEKLYKIRIKSENSDKSHKNIYICKYKV